jgi:hypothetical protein
MGSTKWITSGSWIRMKRVGDASVFGISIAYKFANRPKELWTQEVEFQVWIKHQGNADGSDYRICLICEL